MAVQMDQEGHVLAPLKDRLFSAPLALPLTSLLPTSGGFKIPLLPPPSYSSSISPRRSSAFETVKIIAPPKSDGDEATRIHNDKSATPPALLIVVESESEAVKEEEKAQENAGGMVPNQLSAFPLFGGSGVPQAHSNGTELTEEDMAAWQPVFSSSMAISPRTANVLAPGVGAVGAPHLGFVPGSLFGASPLLSPRTMIADTMIDPMALDPSRATLIPRLNLDAINLHPTGALFTNAGAAAGLNSASSTASTTTGAALQSSSSQFEFAAPLSPSTSSSGRLSRLSSSSALRHGGSVAPSQSSSSYSLSSLSQPSISISHASNGLNAHTGSNSPPQRRYTYGGPPSSSNLPPAGPLSSSTSLSPRGMRVKSARETVQNNADGIDTLAPVSPLTSARGKRRRSIYEDEEAEEPSVDDDENTHGDFIGTYVPTVSSARQKKKRALANGGSPGSPQ